MEAANLDLECPCCGIAIQAPACPYCGYSDHTEVREMPAVEAKPAQDYPDQPGYERNLTAVCPEHGIELEPVGGELVCPACGEEPAPPPVQQPKRPARVEVPDPITDAFLLCEHPTFEAGKYEPCNRDLMMGTNKTPSKFVCSICGDEKPIPVVQSAAVKAAAALPVIGPVAGPVVQAAESAVRRMKRR